MFVDLIKLIWKLKLVILVKCESHCNLTTIKINGGKTLHTLSHSFIPKKELKLIVNKKCQFSNCLSKSENELLTKSLKKYIFK